MALTNGLVKALKGESTSYVPFWEVWFGMPKLAERVIGVPVETLEQRVELARKMGWEYLIAGVPGHHPGSSTQTASDGTVHYVQQGKIPLESLYSRPEPNYSQITENLAGVVNAAHENGFAAIAYVPWCFHAANTALGLEHFSYLLYDEPDYINALFDWVEDGTRRAIREVILPLGFDVVLFDGDCAYKNGLMANPRIFRELVFNRTAETISPLLENGVHCVLHSDGKCDELLPMLIELGFSGFHGVEAQANDLADVKARFGEDITLIGNMDVVFLTHATVEEVRRETEKMLMAGSPNGRYIAACNTSPLDYIPYDNYMAMVDVIKGFRSNSSQTMRTSSP